MPDIADKLTIEYVTLAELEKHRHPENPKDHDIPSLIEGFDRFGFATAITVCDRTGFIAAGHGRLEALQTMRMKGESAPSRVVTGPKDWLAPVIRGWASEDDEELLAYVISDNRQTELGGWKDNLPTLLERIAATQAGLTGVGYTPGGLRQMLAEMKESGTEASNGALLALADVTVGEPLHKCAPGDVYLINGRHTLVVADVMNGWATWAKFLTGECLFVPYPGPYAALSQRADNIAMVMVQPDPFLAGHLLDKFATSVSEDLIEKVTVR